MKQFFTTLLLLTLLSSIAAQRDLYLYGGLHVDYYQRKEETQLFKGNRYDLLPDSTFLRTELLNSQVIAKEFKSRPSYIFGFENTIPIKKDFYFGYGAQFNYRSFDYMQSGISFKQLKVLNSEVVKKNPYTLVGGFSNDCDSTIFTINEFGNRYDRIHFMQIGIPISVGFYKIGKLSPHIKLIPSFTVEQKTTSTFYKPHMSTVNGITICNYVPETQTRTTYNYKNPLLQFSIGARYELSKKIGIEANLTQELTGVLESNNSFLEPGSILKKIKPIGANVGFYFKL